MEGVRRVKRVFLCMSARGFCSFDWRLLFLFLLASMAWRGIWRGAVR